jgi:hypothetical protein
MGHAETRHFPHLKAVGSIRLMSRSRTKKKHFPVVVAAPQVRSTSSAATTPFPSAPRQVPLALQKATASFARANAWVEARLDWFVWAAVFAGVILRIDRGASGYLNGDETQIMYPPLQRTWGEVYRGGLIFPYGPLVNFLLHFMSFFGRSELYFRFPSIIAGALLPLVVYKWVSETFNKVAGVAAACLLAFAPPMVILSAQIRHYMIHMLFMACSIYCLERAIREQSVRWMRLFGAAGVLAILTMYMSVWYLAGIGVYVVVRIFRKELSRRLIAEWAGCQTVFAVILLIAYETHLYLLRGSESERFARDNWLRPSYFHSASQTLAAYLRQSGAYLFTYLFAKGGLALPMIAVFVASLIILAWPRSGATPRPITALSILLPVLATLAAGVLAIYPFGGSRHDAFLEVFVMAGVAAAASFAVKGKALVMVTAFACLVPVWLAAQEHHAFDPEPAVSKLSQMQSALNFLSSHATGQIVVVDAQGAAMVNYYLCHGTVEQWQAIAHHLSTYTCGDYRILAIDVWGAPVGAYAVAVSHARRFNAGLFSGQTWTFYMSDRTTPEAIEQNDRGVFGRIEIDRISL